MKSLAVLIIFSIFFALVSCRAKREISAEDKKIFDEWKNEYNKSYGSEEEEKKAMNCVLRESKEVEEHNRLYEQGKKTYMVGLNEHSDIEEEDFEKLLFGYIEEEEEEGQKSRSTRDTAKFPKGPDSIDWTAKGLVGPVENQRHWLVLLRSNLLFSYYISQ